MQIIGDKLVGSLLWYDPEQVLEMRGCEVKVC